LPAPILVIILAPAAAAGGGLGIVALALLFMFAISDFSNEPGQVNTVKHDAPCVSSSSSFVRLLDNAAKAEKAGEIHNFQTATEHARLVGGYWVAKDSDVRVFGMGERHFDIGIFTVVSLLDVPGKPKCLIKRQHIEVGFWQWAKWKWLRSEAQENVDRELGAKHLTDALAGRQWDREAVTQQEVAAPERQNQEKLSKQAKDERPIKIVVTEDEWTTVTVPPRKCVRFWGVDPKGTAFDAQAITVNSTKAIEWAEYVKAPTDDVGWVKFKSRKGEAVVNYVQFPGPCTSK
jgi:hypothetical protein